MLIEYFFTSASPWSFLGLAPMREAAARHGATILPRPVSFGTIFPATGGLPVAQRAPQRQAYRMAELRRWRQFRNLPLVLEPEYFPRDDSLANRTLLALRERGATADAVLDLAHSFHALLWLEDGDQTSASLLAGRASAQGHDGAALVEAAESADTIALYEKETAAALERGVFGAPTYFLAGEMFWGQDRVDFLERALAAQAGA